MENKIKSVEKGCGENSISFSISKRYSEQYRVDEIKEEQKQVSPNDIFNVYRGYKNGKLIFEMGATIDVTVIYE